MYLQNRLTKNSIPYRKTWEGGSFGEYQIAFGEKLLRINLSPDLSYFQMYKQLVDKTSTNL